MIARKNLFHDNGRVMISIGGVALSVTLVITLLGVYYGMTTLGTNYIVNTKADLWVGQEGIHDLWHTYSLLPRGLGDEIKGVDGVKSVHELIGRAVQIEVPETGGKKTVYIVGFDPASEVGGPWDIMKGSKEIKTGEAIVDHVFFVRNGLQLGDTIKVGDKKLKIVGVSRGTFAVVYPYIFVTTEDAAEIFGTTQYVNYYLVELSGERPTGEVAKDITTKLKERGVAVEILTKERFIQNHKDVINESFNSILFPLVFIGFIIGAAVIGLTLYTMTMEKMREYAILKAIGAQNKFLRKIVFQQAVIITLSGFVAGIGLSLLATTFVPRFAPEFFVEMNSSTVGITFAAVVGMGLLAPLIPIRRLNKVDPVVVFNA
ncbi:ABC transporter permease [Thermococcus sp. 2319x1]|uniref:ABC transporter permease n=1 Tax=Thermococcus sp. 2319x1 TaxID=1674923 RepID=UPI001583FA70|nr:ABC transporter permease [Thermococcus sp. 2319x1]